MSQAPEKITDHVAQANEVRLSQFDQSERLIALLDIVVAEVQRLEDLVWKVLTERGLEVAVGLVLDRIGKIVGWPRHGITDDDEYRRLVRVGAQINLISATAPEVINIFKQLISSELPTIRYLKRYIGHFSLQWELATDTTASWARVVNATMPRIAALGSSWHLVEGVEGEAFQFDTAGRGFDEGQLARRIDTP